VCEDAGMTGTSESGVFIRRATPRDVDGVADVWLRSRKASIPGIPPTIHDEGDVRAWLAEIVHSRRDLWVIAGPEILAMMLLDSHWLDQLYVDPSWTGQGLGSRLLAKAKILHPDRLDLWTFQGNTRARRFYERHGFVGCEMTDGDNEEGAPDIHYLWEGTPP
jgi:GNAT superfamily N-acetyltransferase